MDEKDRSDQPLPGSVSNQNAEAEPGHGDEGDARRRDAGREKESSGGEAKEGSQSTGHPDSAG